MITVLSGGVGAARLLRALSAEMDPQQISAVVNVGDDLVLHGLTICPDLDTITYTLAGLNNDELGWGLHGETWRVMAELEELGGATWFCLGDRDLATHLYRSQRLIEGATKSDVARELAERFGIGVRVLPATNDPVATEFETEIGRISFQDYFVRHRHSIPVSSVLVSGASEACATPEVLDALQVARRIIIAPSNPLISIDPILQIPGIRSILEERRAIVTAVSPLINGAALKGPADRLLGEMGYDVSCVGVADFYKGVIGTLVIDHADAHRAEEVRARGIHVIVTTTIMSQREDAQRLAQALLS